MSDVRLIDATRLEEAFAKECTAECPICSYYKSDAEVDVECHCGLINNAPTIARCGRTPDGFPFMDLRPKPTGKWVTIQADVKKNIPYHIKCSECEAFGLLNEQGYYYFSEYCPFCGAKMKGEEE